MLHDVEHPPTLNGSAPVTSGEVVSDAYVGDGEWLRVGPAAARLGISERTLWRRVRAGALQKRGTHDGLEVWVPLAGTAPVTEGSPPRPAPRTTLAVAGMAGAVTLAVVEELKRRLDADGERLSTLTDEIRGLERSTGRLTAERDAALADRDRLADELARRSRTWWQRLLGR